MAEKTYPYLKPKPRENKPIRFPRIFAEHSASDVQAPFFGLPAYFPTAYSSGVLDSNRTELHYYISPLSSTTATVETMTMPATPGRGRTSRPAPIQLYPAWPNDPTYHGADALVQTFVANLATVVETNLSAGVSQAELCRRAGVGKATLTKIFQGAVWPDSRTVARFETAVRQRLRAEPT